MKHVKTLFFYLMASLFIIFLTSSFTAQSYIDSAQDVDISGKTASIALNKKKIKKKNIVKEEDNTTTNDTRTQTTPQATGTTPQSTKTYDKTYKQGDKDDGIKPYQTKLKTLGYLPSNAKVDGDFGNTTNNAIKKFQKKEGLNVTGELDVDTMKKLDESE